MKLFNLRFAKIGMALAWEAHLGGYIAGAILMAVLPR